MHMKKRLCAGPGCGERNERPIIGVLSQPAVFGEAGESFSVHDIDPSVPSSSTYIAASYVKWIEQTGARVLPIMADDPDDVIERKFR